MAIKSAQFTKGITGDDEILRDGLPQVAFIGRSNVGKSSVINSLTGQKDLARTSPLPGKTREINFYLIDKIFYLVDLPGYGFAKASLENRQILQKMIYWYLLYSNPGPKKTVLIIDALVGPTEYDLDTLRQLKENRREVIVVANKIDKIKKSEYKNKIQDIEQQIGNHILVPYSAEEKTGVNQLLQEILK
jgi:GTP-binding protein